MSWILNGLYAACGFFVLLDIVFRLIKLDKHPYMEWERWPGFYAIYGFVSCVVLVFIAKYALRPLVMKSETFYEDDLAKVEAEREALKAASAKRAESGKEGVEDE